MEGRKSVGKDVLDLADGRPSARTHSFRGSLLTPLFLERGALSPKKSSSFPRKGLCALSLRAEIVDTTHLPSVSSIRTDVQFVWCRRCECGSTSNNGTKTITQHSTQSPPHKLF